MPLRYGRSLDMASIESATATMRARNGHLLALQADRVAAAVPGFVVVAHDGHHLVELLDAVEDAAAQFGMRLDVFELGGVSGPGLRSTLSSMPILPMSCSRPDR